MMGKKILELKNVSKNFILESGKEIKVLERINIQLREDEILAILGPSGSGKSTCLRIMCGLQDATEGEVLVNEKPLVGINSDVSLVFQSFALFPWETIQKNVEIALLPLGLDSGPLKSRVENAIDLVGLEGFEEAYPRELSGGMKQRVGVARALAMERPILFLDEPFSALDVLTADTLRDEIMKIFLSKTTKTRSMVIVTHNIQEAVFMADRILVMSANPGRIHAEFENPLPYPRIPETVPFEELVTRIHGLIAEEYIPDRKPTSLEVMAHRLSHPLVESLPDVPLLDIVGVVETVRDDGGSVDVFELGLEIRKDFGHTLYLVKAAELLNLVETPKQQVILTQLGQIFANADVNERKKILHDNFSRLTIVKKTSDVLKENENMRIPLSELTEKISAWLPNENPEKIVEVLISWGRYAEYFGYNDNKKEIYLDLGQE